MTLKYILVIDAETCDLVGLFLLSKLEKIERFNNIIYRDDGLGVTSSAPRQVEAIKKKICSIFGEYGLKITAEANLKTVDFLDVILDLENESFRPFIKPNNVPLYVNKGSNHPPNVIKNIPAGINKRLSSISSDEKMFKMAAPIYQEALTKSGYDFQLKFDPCAAEPSKKARNRSRHVTWFNPPFNLSVKTNVAAEFLKIVDKCFPKGHILNKIFNRNTLKVSYSCTQNLENIIAGQNSKLLSTPPVDDKLCNCKKDSVCPLGGKCITKELVYQATVKQTDGTTNTYIGLTSTTFKARLGVHKNSFKDPDANQTSLSNHIWDLKSKKMDHSVTWKLVDRGKPFSPVSGKCQLCIKEKFYILFHPEMASLNSKSEIYANCRHKKSKLLIRQKKKKEPPRRRPG